VVDGPVGSALDGAMEDAQSRASDATDDSPETAPPPCPDAVPVCVQYYAYLSNCTQRDVSSLACQESLIPDGSDQLMQIVQLCEENLQRIEQACR
jgi:hypothetical protein